MTTALPFDYHVHTTHSCDAHTTIAAHCRQARAIGLAEIAFTDHLDFTPHDVCYGFYRAAEFHTALEAARAAFPTLTLRAGIEIGEVHLFTDKINTLLAAHPYDLVIGSLHWVGDEIVFSSGYFETRTKDAAALDYFAELLRMVRHGGFEILGHLDVVRRYGAGYYQDFALTPYEDAIRAVLEACIEKGIALEINTSGLRRALGQTHPNLEVLRWYRAAGGELLTVGSDAHRAKDLAAGFDAARTVARAAGFTRLCRFEGRQVAGWVPLD